MAGPFTTEVCNKKMKNQDAFLNGYKLLKIPIINANGTAEWPELFPLEKIDKIRNTVGDRHFSTQMLLNPMSSDKTRLNASAIKFYNDDFDRDRATIGDFIINGISMYWDPSTAHKKTDGSVCVLVMRDDKNRRIFIHECVYLETDDDDLHPLTSQCITVLDLMQYYKIKNIAIEVNGLGNALPEILTREAVQRNQEITVQKIVNHENKEQRIIDAIEPFLSTGRLFAHERIKNTFLFDEMNDWTPTGWMHDDGLDALAGAIKVQAITIRPHGTFNRPIRAKTDFSI
jgi:hypothetical protein